MDLREILLIDDTPDNLRVLESMLEQDGYRVRIATNGANAIKSAQLSHPVLVLLDVMMPDMDGFEVCRQFKADPDICHIPIIFISATNLIEYKIKAFQVGGVDYITKPFLVEEVLARVRIHHQLCRLEDLKREVAERKQAEEALRLNEQRHRMILQTAMDGFLMVDVKGRIVEVNETYSKMSGYSIEELLNMHIYDISTIEGPQENADHIKLIIEQGEDRFESTHRRKDGSLFYTEISVQYRSTDGGFLIAFIRDITERKRIEQEQLKLEDQLLQSQKMESIGRLAGGIAHDFNNMLGVILGHNEIAMEIAEASPELLSHLEEIQKAASRSVDLTRQLLAFARKQTIAPKILDLNDIIASTLKLLHRLIGEDIAVHWIPAINLWMVKMDPSQVDQILANLCVNARDAIYDVGKITIETRNHTIDADYCRDHEGCTPGDYVMIAVSDNGCGMDKETMRHIFEPFYTTKRLGEGTGLGLSMVYGIARQNNGIINVYSEPNSGTTFTIYIPRYSETVEFSEHPQQITHNLHGTEKILLVEDEPAILDMARMMLERYGYTVLSAHTPSEALQYASQHSGNIDLLVTDVVMPEMNGRDLNGHISAIHKNIKCLFMSGYTANVIAHHGVLEEGISFIQKPFSAQSLAIKVREVLDRSKSV